MSGTFDDDGPRWPERDLGRDRERDPAQDPETETETETEQERDLPAPATEASEPITSLGDATVVDATVADATVVDATVADATVAADSDSETEDWDPRRHGDRRRPTTAEQAVPWLIGLLLALTGIVVVLMALIFIGPEGVAGLPSASPTPSTSEQASPSATPISSPTAVPTAAPTAIPLPTFGALDMTFLGRATASSPIRLSRRDFSTTVDPVVIAEDPNGVEHYAWAPDGRVGAAIIAGRAVAIVDGQEPRTLTDPVDALVFADDSTTLYGLRIAPDGTNDRAEVLTIAFESGATEILSTIVYPHKQIFAERALEEAQYADNGGIVRLWVTVDGFLVAWMEGAPATYRIDPANGTFTEVDSQPVLWSPDQRSRIDVAEKSGVTTLTLFDRDQIAQGSVKVTGLVSHVRWAGSNNEIVFTLGRLVGGGVRQDLYVWDLVNGKAPAPLTSNGASFGAEWLGVPQTWLP